MRIAIIGASAAGIFSALVLRRSGHDISLIEQDKFAIAEDAEAAARTAFRTGAPQIVPSLPEIQTLCQFPGPRQPGYKVTRWARFRYLSSKLLPELVFSGLHNFQRREE
jgi:2-polyprenyl-6-methoxyphenol hydroxylase-like FAD-dependent oxidoreductase